MQTLPLSPLVCSPLQGIAKVVRAKCVRHCLGGCNGSVPASVSAWLAAFGVDAASAAATSSCLIAKQPKLKCNQSFFFCLKSKSFAYSRAGLQGCSKGAEGASARGGLLRVAAGWRLNKSSAVEAAQKKRKCHNCCCTDRELRRLDAFFCCCSRNVCGSWPFPPVFLPMP